ncbi:hypothetical protein TBLA_0E04480 [Henningerozyma blattae CBS 6284]|uniref:Uncharacterized protein n=1 Tax=Henningerozyma blattae (strain ATCC 34711 / CBS 6284 / DSM 70876 / NBRC 10599 / NRRL Y-10934 / UCD 77-7) TaxID=1071380 RepID=I2H549_HENB6|nr:hypothetical protein TBLA_0E04480 [Tetrapisispora blattae CBS 6284]CCH61501.1 hypothetical protein TBLA_0E04480 [Tetrapisispora blattae CBS 6284]
MFVVELSKTSLVIIISIVIFGLETLINYLHQFKFQDNIHNDNNNNHNLFIHHNSKQIIVFGIFYILINLIGIYLHSCQDNTLIPSTNEGTLLASKIGKDFDFDDFNGLLLIFFSIFSYTVLNILQKRLFTINYSNLRHFFVETRRLDFNSILKLYYKYEANIIKLTFLIDLYLLIVPFFILKLSICKNCIIIPTLLSILLISYNFIEIINSSVENGNLIYITLNIVSIIVHKAFTILISNKNIESVNYTPISLKIPLFLELIFFIYIYTTENSIRDSNLNRQKLTKTRLGKKTSCNRYNMFSFNKYRYERNRYLNFEHGKFFRSYSI